MEFGKIIAVCLDQIVHHSDNVVNRKLGSSVRLQHCRVIYKVALAGDGSLNGDQLRVDIGHVHCRQLNRQPADTAGMNAVAVDQAGNFDTGIFGQVFDQTAAVEHVAADLVRRAGDNGFHDARSVFVRAFVRQLAFLAQFVVFFFPAVDLVDAAPGVFIQRNVVTVDQFWIFGFDKETYNY